MVYTVTLNPAIDYVVCLDGRVKLGEINRSTREAFQFGGKGINVSNVLRALDVPTAALGFVAGFTGEALEKGLLESGLETRFIHAQKGCTRVNVKLKADEETEINGIGPDISADEFSRFCAGLDALDPGDILVLSGSVPGCLGTDAYETILARLEGRGIRAVVDTAGDALLRTLKYKPFLIKPNLQELEDIFAAPLTTDAAIAASAAMLQKMGARNVLVSLGARGALLLDETGNAHRMDCPKGQVINSVGAGDSMVAGFLAGYLRTGDYDCALKLGIAAGSATAFSLGLAEKSKIEALYAQM